jgi:hypothetical protein
MIGGLVAVVRCCGIDMNVEKTKEGKGKVKATFFSTDYDRSKTT